MSKTKQHYDFLPDGWYFIVEEEDEYDETRLYTASGVEVAWFQDYSVSVQILKGMEHESEFIQSLFDQKSAQDRYDEEQSRLRWSAESAQRDQEELDKVRRDFENINRPQPEKPSQDTAFFDFEKRLNSFKQKLKLK